ncbi:hypothetical protein Acsp02_30440 [Actinoplanes sp. NBRC 103695]|nr:hypothetical protein Acsp02_30440 [Actinoplanes sp. NBRC 103695]
MTTITIHNPTRETTEMTLNGAPKMRLIQEALSRARMRRPQADPEAHRSARRVAMEARQRAARELGGRPL